MTRLGEENAEVTVYADPGVSEDVFATFGLSFATQKARFVG